MKSKQKIYFVHEGQANYPSIKGFKEIWANKFTMEECTFQQALTKPDLKDAICWHMMGFYRHNLPCKLTVHDYRSLSTGKGRRFKDWLKTTFNATPTLRVIQPSIKPFLKFRDTIPEVLIDVGISDSILQYRNLTTKKSYDFCYIGAMKAERKLERMLDSFLIRYGSTKTFVMVGTPETYLVERYKPHANITFVGQQPLEKVFSYVNQSHVAVCFFPNHYPHTVQTPTKLLEAAALGSRIFANDQPMNHEKAKEYGIQAHWGTTEDIFATMPDSMDWPDNAQTNPTPMLWSNLILASKLETVLKQILETK